MADDNWKKLTWSMIEAVENRLAALESRKCNCSAASSAGSSAHGGASPSAPSSSSSGAAGATGSSDPVSAAIRDGVSDVLAGRTTPVGETAWDRFLARHGFKPTVLMVRVHEEAFNEAVAAEVAAAKAKPHAETAEEKKT